MGKKKKRIPPEGMDEPIPHNLGSLMSELGFKASESAPPPPPMKASATDAIDLQKQGKLVLRMERKGRGGKTVTVLSKLQASPDAMNQLAKQLRRALGSGARVDGNDIIIQGDVRDRTRAWLMEHGARAVST